MNRRVVLVGAASALSLLAGCTGDSLSDGPTSQESTTRSASSATPSTASLSTTPASTPGETETTDTANTARTTDPEGTATGTTTRCGGGFSIAAHPFDVAEDATAPLDDESRAVVAEAVEDGKAEQVGYGGTPFPELTRYGREPTKSGVFVAHEGAFYEIDYTVESTTVSGYKINVEWERGEKAPDDADVIGFADLPENDRAALRIAVAPPEAKGTGEGGATDESRFPEQGFSIGEFPVPYPDGGDGSRLVGDGVTWVSWDDHDLEVEIGEATETKRRTHTYTADRVAGSTAGFEKVVASRYRVELTGLPADERAIMERAVQEQYRGCGTIAETVPELRDRLSNEMALPTPSGNTWYVRFEDEDYEVTMSQWVS